MSYKRSRQFQIPDSACMLKGLTLGSTISCLLLILNILETRNSQLLKQHTRRPWTHSLWLRGQHAAGPRYRRARLLWSLPPTAWTEPSILVCFSLRHLQKAEHKPSLGHLCQVGGREPEVLLRVDVGLPVMQRRLLAARRQSWRPTRCLSRQLGRPEGGGGVRRLMAVAAPAQDGESCMGLLAWPPGT